MKKLWLLFDHRTVWTSGPALLAIVAVLAMAGLMLKALGSVHGASLNAWLLDVGQNMGWFGAIGGFFSAAAASAGWPGFFRCDPYPPFAPPHYDLKTGPPPGFNNWPVPEQRKWVNQQVQDRRENPDDTLWDLFSLGAAWSIQQTTGTSATTQANGCSKG
jgi:hypothetical protein